MQDLILRIAPIFISIVSLTITLFLAVKARRDVRLQRHLQALGLRRQYFALLQQWGNEVVAAMTSAIFLCDLAGDLRVNKQLAERIVNVRSSLSSLADRERWFLPNERPDNHDLHKPMAFRGVRQPALDYVIAAYRAVEELEQSNDNLASDRAFLWEVRRNFVSDLQSVLAPDQREGEI